MEEQGLISHDDPISLRPSDLENATEWEDFVGLWMISKEIDMRNQWFKGDIANRVAIVRGEGSLRQFAMDVQEKGSTVESYRRVSRAFPPPTRHANLSWTHYFLASYTDSYNKGEKKFDTDKRYDWVEKASDEGWSTARMAKEIKKEQALVEDADNVFRWYDEYLDSVRNVLLHIEKDKLDPEQAQLLQDKLLNIHNELDSYFGDMTPKSH
jgi:hypothetical protein